MKRFATAITIRAPAETIWSILTDASGYPIWNSTVEKITGQIAPGKKVTVHARATPGGRVSAWPRPPDRRACSAR